MNCQQLNPGQKYISFLLTYFVTLSLMFVVWLMAGCADAELEDLEKEGETMPVSELKHAGVVKTQTTRKKIKCKFEEVRHRISYVCLLTPKSMRIDGVLNEDAWQGAEVIRKFMVPVTHVPSRRQTEARIMWDKQYLYVAFKATDKDILGIHSVRDSDTYRDDVLEFFFKTNSSQRSYYNLEVNPLSTIRDEYHCPDQAGVLQWLTTWNCDGLKVGVKIVGTLNDWRDQDKRWQLEIAIPFASLPSLKGRTPRPGDVWNFRLSRIERSLRSRQAREMTSCSPLTSNNFHSSKNWLLLKFQGFK